VNDRRFYACYLEDQPISLPFSDRPFTVLVEIRGKVSSTRLENCARELLDLGCVHAICRGGDAELMNEIFQNLTEEGVFDREDCLFTSMAAEEESLQEVMEYFTIPPSDLIAAGLILIIGGVDSFPQVVEDFISFSDPAPMVIDDSLLVEEEVTYV
jgi:hypothetical protein